MPKTGKQLRLTGRGGEHQFSTVAHTLNTLAALPSPTNVRSGSNVGANPLVSPPLTLFLQAAFATSAVWTVTHELVFLVTREGTGLDPVTCVIFDYEGQRQQCPTYITLVCSSTHTTHKMIWWESAAV